MSADIRINHETISSADMQEEIVWRPIQQSPAFSHLSAAAALITLALFSWQEFSIWLLAWLAGFVALVSSLTVLRIQHQSKHPDTTQRNQSSRHAQWAAFASGVLWGLPAAVVGDVFAHPDASALVTIICATLAGYYFLHTRPPLFRAFQFGLVGSAAISLLFTKGGIQALPGIALILAIYALLDAAAKRSGEAYRQVLRLEREGAQRRKELQEAQRSLESQRQLDLQEETVARHVFQQLTLGSDQGLPGIATWNEPMGKLSGDLIQVARGPRSDIYLFLGDFTGHGLPAALGAVPASTIFRTMVRKGLEVSMIAQELNRKLHLLLPTGYFCCSAIMKLAPDRRHFTLWNGGLPPLLIRRHLTGSIKEIGSDNLPLGVLSEQDFSSDCSTWDLEEGDRVLVYSDGLTEAENVDGEMWGKDRLSKCLSESSADCSMIETLKSKILEFTRLAPPSDDLSIIEVVAGKPCSGGMET